VLLELFQRRNAALVSVAEALDTGSAAGRLLLNIMVSSASGSGKPSASGREMRCSTRKPRMMGRKRAIRLSAGFRQAPRRTRAEGAGDLPENSALRKDGKSLRKIADQLNFLEIRTVKDRLAV